MRCLYGNSLIILENVSSLISWLRRPIVSIDDIFPSSMRFEWLFSDVLTWKVLYCPTWQHVWFKLWPICSRYMLCSLSDNDWNICCVGVWTGRADLSSSYCCPVYSGLWHLSNDLELPSTAGWRTFGWHVPWYLWFVVSHYKNFGQHFCMLHGAAKILSVLGSGKHRAQSFI